jgi:putative oxidoreductase
MTNFFRGNPISIDIALLIIRVGAGLLMLTHGWPKLINFSSRMHSFGDPYHIGSPASLVLTVFAEFICSILLVLGYFSRFATIPLIITMATVIFMVHWPDPFAKKELPLLFLTCFVAIFFAGPGKYSLDGK